MGAKTCTSDRREVIKGTTTLGHGTNRNGASPIVTGQRPRVTSGTKKEKSECPSMRYRARKYEKRCSPFVGYEGYIQMNGWAR